MKIKTHLLRTLLLPILLLALIPQSAQAQTPAVRALLFYSPTCPACHEIMSNFLPLLTSQYGEQLQILNVDVTTAAGQSLYQQAIQAYGIPESRLGVPTMIAGQAVLVGRYEIQDSLAPIIDQALTGAGLDWPQLPGLEAVLESGTFPFFGAEDPFAVQPGIWERFNQDPLANSLSVIVLFGMVFSFFQIMRFYFRTGKKETPVLPQWVIPVVALAGLAIAAYLSFVEIQEVEAVCGPVGDCNLVQQSQYARLFGLIPIGVLGVGAYIAVLGAWLIQHFGVLETKKAAFQSMWLISVIGTLFSIYLTFLEPFVIGATCIWCISSAVAMTALLWLTTFKTIELRKPKHRRYARG